MPQQVDVVEPIARALSKHNIEMEIYTLDRWYRFGALQAAEGAGLHAAEIVPDKPAGKGSFYRRSTFAIWWDVLRARRPIDAVVRDARLLLLANDFGLLEKVAIRAARNRAVPVALVQDGRLWSTLAPPPSFRMWLFALAKRLMSPPLRWAGFEYLAASKYGQGGTDIAFASGEHGAKVLRRLSRGTKVVVTGQPKYDKLVASRTASDPTGPVIMFTTAFETEGLGSEVQRAQERFANALRDELRKRGIPFVVKPHPREDHNVYVQLLGASSVSFEPVPELLARSRAAVVGISTVIEEAGLLSCPVFVPGSIVHGSRFDAFLPPRHAYRRFESAASMAAAIAELSNQQGRQQMVSRQWDAVSYELHLDPTRPAAAVIAALIVEHLAPWSQ
jgi:hypothetical protein